MKGRFHSYSCDTKDRYAVHIYLIVISIGLTYMIQLICSALNKEIPWWLGVPGIFSIYGGFYYVFAKFLWKSKIFRALFLIKTPKIAGLYSGILKSSHDNFESEKNIDIQIWQSWDKILICLKTDTSKSFSQQCSISINNQTIPTISYLYLNEPMAGSVKSMEIHYGMCTLFFDREDINGDFFTGRGRQTYGTLKTYRIK